MKHRVLFLRIEFLFNARSSCLDFFRPPTLDPAATRSKVETFRPTEREKKKGPKKTTRRSSDKTGRGAQKNSGRGGKQKAARRIQQKQRGWQKKTVKSGGGSQQKRQGGRGGLKNRHRRPGYLAAVDLSVGPSGTPGYIFICQISGGDHPGCVAPGI